MLCDVDPPHEDHVVELLRPIDEAGETVGASRIAADPRMTADGHHASAVVTVVSKPVQRSLGEVDEVLRAAEALRKQIATVVDHERVRHDQVRPALDERPVGQVVVIAVGVIDEAALLTTSSLVLTLISRQYQPSGRLPVRVVIDATARLMASRSSSRVISK